MYKGSPMSSESIKTDTNNEVRTVFFDFDGTLTLPGALDFHAIRTDMGCPADRAILEYIDTLPDPAARNRAISHLQTHEIAAARDAVPNEGAVEIIRWLDERRLPVGIITRNSRASVDRALANFPQDVSATFAMIITRDDKVATKPSGEGLAWAAKTLRVAAGQILMVGDYVFDIQAGHDAGCRTVLLDTFRAPHLQSVACDHRIAKLLELKTIIGNGS